MRKTTILAILLIGILACVSLTACNPNDNQQNDDLWTIERVYAEAQALGFEGTLDELIESLRGADGKDGVDGVGIKSVRINSDGELVITLSNNIEINCGHVKGDQGEKGAQGEKGDQGIGIVNAYVNPEGELIVVLTDGKEINLGDISGRDGLGVESFEVNSDGELVVTYTDGSTQNLGSTPKCVHSYSEYTVELTPTCTSIGCESRTCTKCDYKDYKFTEAKGHSVGIILSRENWLHYYLCNDCEECIIQAHDYEKECETCAYNSSGYLGMKYTFNEVSQSYFITGIGSCTEEEIVIPSTFCNLPVTGIANYAFYNCLDIKSIIIPDSVTYIGNSAFYGCARLTNITIPFVGEELNGDYNTYFGYIFGIVPESLKSVIITGGTSIGSSAFRGCSGLTNITIPDSVTSIGSYAFYDCSGLTNITIPDNVTYIGNRAFSNCAELTSVMIPDSIASLGNFVFAGCTKLTTINYSGTVEQWENIDREGKWEVVIAAVVTIKCSNGEIKIQGEYDYIFPLAQFTLGQYFSDKLVYNPTLKQWRTHNGVDFIAYAGAEVMAVLSGEVKSVENTTLEGTVITIELVDGNIAIYKCLSERVTVNEGELVQKGDVIGYVNNMAAERLVGPHLHFEMKKDGAYLDPLDYLPENLPGTPESEYFKVTYCANGGKMEGHAERYFYIERSDNAFVIKPGSEALPQATREGYTILGWAIGEINEAGEPVLVDEKIYDTDGGIYITADGAVIEEMASDNYSYEHKYYAYNRELLWDFEHYYLRYNLILVAVWSVENTEPPIEEGDNRCDIEHLELSVDDVCSICGMECYDIQRSGNSILMYNRQNGTMRAEFYGEIAGNEFYSYRKMIFEIYISTEVKKIESYAFSDSYAKKVIIADGSKLQTIENGAFNCCYSLSEIELNKCEFLTTIGDSAFSGCSLESITIPDSVIFVGDWAFRDTKWYNNQPAGLVYLQHVAYKYKGTMPFDTKIELKEGTRVIASCCFADVGANLRSITLSDSLEYIGPYAFSRCAAIRSIDLPEALKELGRYAFGECNGLNEVVIPDNVLTIGESAFNSCSNLMSITLGNKVTKIEKLAFALCDKLTNVFYKGTLEQYNKIAIDNSGYTGSPGQDNRYLHSATKYYFSVNEPSEEQWNESEHWWHYAENGDIIIWTRELEYSLNEDGQSYTVVGIGSVTDSDVVIPSTYKNKPVTSIGKEAFSGCANIKSVIMLDSITTIEEEAFFQCRNLQEVKLPNTLTYIGEAAFLSCNSLKEISIPSKVTYMGNNAFSYCYRIEKIIVSIDNNKYHSKDNCLIETETNTLIFGCKTSIIPNYVINIGDNAFKGCEDLFEVMIPFGVASIGEHAFYGCYYLRSISIPSSVTIIGEHAFYDCSGLESSIDLSNISHIGSFAFGRCYLLEEIIMPTTIKSMGEGVFYDCENLKSIAIPGGVTIIGQRMFYRCRNLESVIIPEGVTDIEYWAFYCCENLQEIMMPNSLISIGNEAFLNCYSLVSIAVPDSVTSIGSRAFCQCYSLERI